LFKLQNSLLPPHARCKDQTEKKATGPYQRDKLLKYLEEQAKGEKDWEEVVPFAPGTKRGKVFEPKDQPDEGTEGMSSGKGEMHMPIELDIDDEEEEEEFNENDDTVIEKALKNAPERDLVDLAGILGKSELLGESSVNCLLLPTIRHAQCAQPTPVLQCTEGERTERGNWLLIQRSHQSLPATRCAR
jgi:tropomodulin